MFSRFHVNFWKVNPGEESRGWLKGGCSRGVGKWGTPRICREDWGTLRNISED